jgi:hypothetical protein
LRHLESYLGELASSFEETDGPERERSDELVSRARRRASELEAKSFEGDIEGEPSKTELLHRRDRSLEHY